MFTYKDPDTHMPLETELLSPAQTGRVESFCPPCHPRFTGQTMNPHTLLPLLLPKAVVLTLAAQSPTFRGL